MIYICESNIRIDGRLPEEIRKIEVIHGVVNGNGLVSLSQGTTCVTATVLPQSEKNAILLEFLEITRPEVANEKIVSELKTKINEIFSEIIFEQDIPCISITVVQDGGGLLPVTVNCISLCLMYNGIAMKDLCFGACVNDLFDLSKDEISKSRYNATLVYQTNNKKIGYFEASGCIQPGDIQRSISNGIECVKVFSDYFSKYLKEIL